MAITWFEISRKTLNVTTSKKWHPKLRVCPLGLYALSCIAETSTSKEPKLASSKSLLKLLHAWTGELDRVTWHPDRVCIVHSTYEGLWL